MGANLDLNCIVSESFEEYDDGAPDLELYSGMIDKLAQVQLDSRQCLEELQKSGFTDRSPLAIVHQIDKWLGSDTTLKGLLELAFQEFVDNAEAIKKALVELEEYGIPLTLVHGDVHCPTLHTEWTK